MSETGLSAKSASAQVGMTMSILRNRSKTRTTRKWEMNPEILAPVLFGQQKDAAQKVGGQWRMIEIAAVRISPFESMFVQHFGEAVKENGIVGADRVIGEREFQRHRDERQRDDKRRAQITRGAQ